MSYDCLTIDFAQQVGAQFIVRGIRTVKDFEYEETIADINRKLAGIETILLSPSRNSLASVLPSYANFLAIIKISVCLFRKGWKFNNE